MRAEDVLKDAQAAPEKRNLEQHRQAILELRKKSYSWREIADFLTERGVTTDHTKVYRFITKDKNAKGNMNMEKVEIPTAVRSKAKLSTLSKEGTHANSEDDA